MDSFRPFSNLASRLVDSSASALFSWPRAMPVAGCLQSVCLICRYSRDQWRFIGRLTFVRVHPFSDTLAHLFMFIRSLSLSSRRLAWILGDLTLRRRSRILGSSFSTSYSSPSPYSGTARVKASRARPLGGGHCHGSDRWAGGLRVTVSYDDAIVLLLVYVYSLGWRKRGFPSCKINLDLYLLFSRAVSECNRYRRRANE